MNNKEKEIIKVIAAVLFFIFLILACALIPTKGGGHDCSNFGYFAAFMVIVCIGAWFIK